ncbi:MAG: sigma-70 family RNA polymerase sigma factor [Candidatus Margulisbacteria bacterium]|nr:sigma-70 family RNA polymerase sigma factor [Candidatus Margulisiibacteriota bacterium]
MAQKKETLEIVWKKIEKFVIADIKKHLTSNYSEQILKKFSTKIKGLVGKYLASLPSHVTRTEGDDLFNVARIEFFQTIKQWDPKKSTDVWPLAYSRITGAMKDHIRYLTKADPSRLYDWIKEAANLYQVINKHAATFEAKIENGVTLNHAMECLSEKEKNVIIGRYKSDKTFKEIGDEIGVSESQATRIYKTSIKKLKSAVKEP